MRTGSTWSDVCIVDLSSRGVGLQVAQPPPRGSYVELRKGQHVIIAKVAWSQDRRCGALTQDPLHIESLLGAVERSGETPVAEQWPERERRQARRCQTAAADRSRMAGRTMEFTGLVAALFAVAAMLSGLIEQSLGQPMESVAASLTAGRPADGKFGQAGRSQSSR